MPKKKPLVSFVVPVYKPDEVLLSKCIRSLREQSLKDFEVVFVIDGDFPAVHSMISRECAGKNLDYRVIEQVHEGACAARNRGIEETKSKYVWFWDCDCVIEPHTAKAMIELMEEKKDIDFVYGGYKFLDEQGAINSEPFDPWTLKVRNYISTCFPVRRELLKNVRWNESLESLQDWDFWLSVVEAGGKGQMLEGYAFSTAFPTENSISGRGCRPEVWLDRLNKVKKLHNLPFRETCVSALGNKLDGINFAKMIDADYQNIPNGKPHDYKTIIQIGFSLLPGEVETHSSIFGQKGLNYYIFWTAQDLTTIYNRVNFNAIRQYSTLLNEVCKKQFVEDKRAAKMMQAAGFDVEILPLPLKAADEIPALPKERRMLVDVSENYGQLMAVLERSLPDVQFDTPQNARPIAEYAGILHLKDDKTMTSNIKRMALSGRTIVSNVQAPHTGYINDDQDPSVLIPKLVQRIRLSLDRGANHEARDFYKSVLSVSKVKEALA